MLIEQFIEFELKRLEPPGRITCTPKTDDFYEKQKSLRKIFEWIIKQVLDLNCK